MLQLENLSCGYGEMLVVQDLDLAVERGAITALIGANGAGKTTTIRTIMGFVQPSAGRVLLDGVDLSSVPAQERVRAGIAIAPEGRQLFPDLTVRENLAIGGYHLDAKSRHAAFEPVCELFPRIRQRLEQPAGTLSGGEQQMVAIGRALMAQPSLLLIDEVSLGLMPLVIDQCYEAIARLRDDGLGILLVEQNTHRATAIADTVAVLESGRCVWHGSGEDAVNASDLVNAYLGMTGLP